MAIVYVLREELDPGAQNHAPRDIGVRHVLDPVHVYGVPRVTRRLVNVSALLDGTVRHVSSPVQSQGGVLAVAKSANAAPMGPSSKEARVTVSLENAPVQRDCTVSIAEINARRELMDPTASSTVHVNRRVQAVIR